LMKLLFFLGSVFVISLSGALQPGPVTATAIAEGMRSRFAGLLIAVGHAIIELPLMILILFGVGRVFQSTLAQVIIGLAGGAVLLYMAVGMLASAKKAALKDTKPVRSNPVAAGIVLTAGNPYFLIWWATIGLGLTVNMRQFGLWAFPLFALVHWICDAAWLTFLSWTSYKGAEVLGPQRFRVALQVCAVAMFLFAAKFIYGAVKLLQI